MNKIMAKKVLLVEGKDERDLCSLLINNKLGLKAECSTPNNFINDDDVIQIISINEVDNKKNIDNFTKAPNYTKIEKLAIIVDAEQNIIKRFDLFNNIITVNYQKNQNCYIDNNTQNIIKGLFLVTDLNNKNSGCLENVVEEVIKDKDYNLYTNCVENFFNCSNKIINQGNNQAHILKSKILSFISVKCKKRNTIGGLFQDTPDYLNSCKLNDITNFLKKVFIC